MRDMRFGFAYALVPHPRVGRRAAAASTFGLVGRLEVSAPTGDSDQFAGERSGRLRPQPRGATGASGGFFAGAELGARIRPTTEVLGARVGTQLVTALGAGYDILREARPARRRRSRPGRFRRSPSSTTSPSRPART